MPLPRGQLDRSPAIKGGQTEMQRNYRRLVTCLLFGAGLLCTAAPSMAQPTSPSSTDGLLGAIVKSLTGDVYADPSAWRELSLRDFFSEGRDRAWVSPPPGGGGAPRQGWLNSFDGGFYPLRGAAPGHPHKFPAKPKPHPGPP